VTTVVRSAPGAGVGQAGVQPAYTTSGLINVGASELEPVHMSVNVLSIPASRLELGIDASRITDVFTGEGEFLAEGLTQVGESRHLRDDAAMSAIAWAVTAASVRALNRLDLDVKPGPVDSYARVWHELGAIEREVFRLANAPLFVTENSPPKFKTAASFAGGGVATTLLMAGHLSAGTIVLAPLGIFLITAAPIAGKAFGEYLEDVIKRLPGSRG